MADASTSHKDDLWKYGILAALGGLVNPLGSFYLIASALPSTLGANAGLLSLLFTMRCVKRNTEGPVGEIQRGAQCIPLGAIVSLLFIFILGRGLT